MGSGASKKSDLEKVFKKQKSVRNVYITFLDAEKCVVNNFVIPKRFWKFSTFLSQHDIRFHLTIPEKHSGEFLPAGDTNKHTMHVSVGGVLVLVGDVRGRICEGRQIAIPSKTSGNQKSFIHLYNYNYENPQRR